MFLLMVSHTPMSTDQYLEIDACAHAYAYVQYTGKQRRSPSGVMDIELMDSKCQLEVAIGQH